MAAVQSDPADARWQAHIGRLVAGFLDADGAVGYAPLDEVWSLREQLR